MGRVSTYPGGAMLASLCNRHALDVPALASLRNRIAHSYGGPDVVRMVREWPAGFEIVTQHLDELLVAPPRVPDTLFGSTPAFAKT